jgi:hypothetical protein
MPDFKIAIVAPVHVPLTKEWIESLKAITVGKENVSVIIVDDSNGKVELPSNWRVYDYARQLEELGPELYARFEKFHKSSACKNFGHWLAWKEGYDIVMGLDSDCVVPPNFISEHLEALMMKSHGWTNVIKNTGWFSRGYPYVERERPTILSLGLWEGELDLYGTDRVANPTKQVKDPMITASHEVADGIVPLSGMNWAAWTQAIPAFLLLPNFEYTHGEQKKVYEFRRHDDIWGGYIFQRLMAIRNERIVYGKPIVWHQTVVKPEEDAKEEEAMIAFENSFYREVDYLVMTIEWGMYDDMFEAFSEAAAKRWKGTEFEPLIEALDLWVELFKVAPAEEEEEEELGGDKEI